MKANQGAAGVDGESVAMFEEELGFSPLANGAVQYRLRVMQLGSPRARLIKLADRFSNLYALGFVHDVAFVKKYVEERELTVMLMVDVSASETFGSTGQSKREIAAEVQDHQHNGYQPCNEDPNLRIASL